MNQCLFGLIYLLRNKVNGKCYVGQTCGELKNRLIRHLRANTLIGRALRKYGLSNFETRVIDIAISREWLDRKEIQWITFFRTQTDGYNLWRGGLVSSGWNHSPESNEKNRKSHLGKKLSLETRHNMSLASIRRHASFPSPMLGKHHSEETKRKLSEHFKALIRTPTHCQRISQALRGIKRSAETRQRISDAKRGKSPRFHIKYFSEYARAQIGAAQLGNTSRIGKKHTEESKQKMRDTKAAHKKAREELYGV